MKTLFTLLGILPLLVSGQAILNGNFESWNTTTYDDLDGYFSSNKESIPNTGLVSTFRTTDGQSGLAVKMTTVTDGSNVNAGWIMNSDGDPFNGDGGMPYAAIPSAITGYYKYNILGNDSALLLVFFKSGGTLVSMDIIKITGQQPNYVPFSFPLNLTMMPDSVIIAAASSNQIGQVSVTPGSTLFLDQIAFTGAGTMPPIDNGDFENWTPQEYDELTGWGLPEDIRNIRKTTDSYAGNFALKLVSDIGDNGNPQVAGITSGYFDVNGPQGGRPYSQMTDVFTAWYQYDNTSGDNGMLFLSFYANGVNVGYYSMNLEPTNGYTAINIPISLFTQPDTVRIDLMSSEWPFDSVGNGSELVIDEIQFASEPLNTAVPALTDPQSLLVYPNPTTGQVTMILGYPVERGSLDIFSSAGVLVYSKALHRDRIVYIDLGDVSSGIYFVRLTDGTKYYYEKISRE